MERLFSFLFKYRPLLFQEGEIVFQAPWPLLWALALGGGAAAVGIITYARAGGRATAVERGVMAGLRIAALGVLLFCLFQPTLVLTSVVPQRNFVGVVVDDSRSMTLADESGTTRADWVRQTFGTEDNELVEALEERFALRYFRFSSDASRVSGIEELTFDGTRTDMGAALRRAQEDLSSVPLSGLVVVSDGADNSGVPLAQSLVPLQAASVPVFSVGLGEELLSPDIQVDRADAPRAVLTGTSLVLDVVITARGLEGRTVPLLVEDESRILTSRDVVLPDAGEPTVVRVRFTMEEAGPRRLSFRVPVQEGERVARNNVRTLLVEVRDEREKILYFEGEPRFEVGFLRRAVQDDEHLQLVVLQRTAENKYLRLAVDDSTELLSGFPRTREELFKYRGLILGSVEASYFSHDQLSMITDFVSQRGGGLLVLGGRNALAEGGYDGTPLAEALPVLLEPAATDPRAAFVEVQVRPTPAGLNHPATQILPGEEASLDRWDSLPPLSSLNRIVRVKPGATVLLSGDGGGEERVVLAHHRYGRGKVLALPIQDSWIWQMHADVALEDQTHETFWRQLLRWLVDGVPEHVVTQPDRERVEVGESVRVLTEVNDSTYIEVNDAIVTAVVTAADGTQQILPMEWTLERDGEYAASFQPSLRGPHDVRIEAVRDEHVIGTDAIQVDVGPSDGEYFDAAQRRQVLERLAQETGGRYYTPETVSSLPEDLRYTGRGVTLVEERDIWDMPILFLLLLALVGSEWAFRRMKGLV